MNRHILVCIVLMGSMMYAKQMTFLVFGSTGSIGKKIVTLLKDEGHRVVAAVSHLEQRESIIHEIERIKPDCVINAASIPTIDWCEDHKPDIIRINIIGTLNLADVTYLHCKQMITINSGCGYEYNEEHAAQEDITQVHGSFYSQTKCILDALLKYYPNVLNLRLRVPISSDMHPHDFMANITRYQKIPNALSILDDVLPLIPRMAERGLTGTYDLVNPGIISHDEIVALYKKYIDPQFYYSNAAVEEQKSYRSSGFLDATKLSAEFPEVRPIRHAMIALFEKMQNQQVFCAA